MKKRNKDMWRRGVCFSKNIEPKNTIARITELVNSENLRKNAAKNLKNTILTTVIAASLLVVIAIIACPDPNASGTDSKNAPKKWSEVTPADKATAVTNGTLFSARSYFSSVVLDGDIYVIGGFETTTVYYNDVWKSSNKGVTWEEVTPKGNPSATPPVTKAAALATAVTNGDLFSARFNHKSVVLGSDIYVIGGINANKYNDVWVYK